MFKGLLSFDELQNRLDNNQKLTEIQKVKLSLRNEFNEMSCIPLFEFELKDNYLTVAFSIDRDGFCFWFDDNNLPVHFDGIIKKKGRFYVLPFDVYFDSLDYYLDLIYQNIMEGYILPNDLYKPEE